MSTRCGNLQRDWKYRDLAKALHWIVPLLSSSLMLFSVFKKPGLLFDLNDTVQGIYGLLLYFPFGKVSKECLCKENLHTENHLIFCFPIHNDGILLTTWSIWWAILYFFKLQNKQTIATAFTTAFFFFFAIPWPRPNSFSAKHKDHHPSCRAPCTSVDPSLLQPFRLSGTYFHASVFFCVKWEQYSIYLLLLL